MQILTISIKEEEIYYLLMNLKEILNNNDRPSEVHITLKGPQEKFDDHKSREKFLNSNYPIYIDGVGVFHNNRISIVYLKAKCEGIKGHMWNKPDYNDEYNPHITIFKGKDKEKSEAIMNFLKSENISLTCNAYDISTILLKQLNLFYREYPRNENGFKNLVESGIIKKGILQRAKELVDLYT